MANEEIKVKTGGNVYAYNPRRSGMLLNAKQMAEFAGISEQAFHQTWIAQGCPCVPNPQRPSEKSYPSAMVMKWRSDKDLASLRQSLVGVVEISQGEMTILEADRRKKQADALLAELKLANENEQVANIEDLVHNFSIACENVTATVLGWRANLVGLLTMQEEDKIDEVLADEIGRLLTNLKNYNHEYEDAPDE